MLFSIGATEDAALGASSAARRHRQCFVKPSWDSAAAASSELEAPVSGAVREVDLLVAQSQRLES